jgi:hypothetical protein
MLAQPDHMLQTEHAFFNRDTALPASAVAFFPQLISSLLEIGRYVNSSMMGRLMCPLKKSIRTSLAAKDGDRTGLCQSRWSRTDAGLAAAKVILSLAMN